MNSYADLFIGVALSATISFVLAGYIVLPAWIVNGAKKADLIMMATVAFVIALVIFVLITLAEVF